MCFSTHQGVHNSTQRCVILTHLFTYNQKTHHGVLENTPRCAGKHINMCKKTHQDVYKNTPYFYTPFITHLWKIQAVLGNTPFWWKHTMVCFGTHHAQVWETQLGVLESTPCFWYVTKQKYEEFYMVNINDI